MSLVCFIQAAEYGATKLFMPAFLRAMTGDVCLSANEVVLLPLPCRMRAYNLKCGHLRATRCCAVDPAAVLLVFACAGSSDWTVRDSLGRFL